MVLNKEEGTAHSLTLAQAEENEKSGDDGFSDDESFDETAWVKGIFDDFAKGSNHIATPDFPKLLEALGLTYCEEDHRRTIKKISSVEDSITFKAFFDWYIDWMYGDGDKDEEAPKTPFTSTSAPAPVASPSAFPPMSRAAPKNSFTSTSAPAPAASSSAQAPATAASAKGVSLVPIDLSHALASQAA